MEAMPEKILTVQERFFDKKLCIRGGNPDRPGTNDNESIGVDSKTAGMGEIHSRCFHVIEKCFSFPYDMKTIREDIHTAERKLLLFGDQQRFGSSRQKGG